MKIEIGNICSVFAAEVIGSRVINRERFLEILEQTLAAYDPSQDRVVGQHKIDLPREANEVVSAGVGRRTNNPDDYVPRSHRGRVLACLKREKAASAELVSAIVYTCEAYLADPEVLDDTTEFSRIEKSGCTHVLVAVLASAGPMSPLTAHRFVFNLGGGNNEALAWSRDEIRAKAAEIAEYWNDWDVVAD